MLLIGASRNYLALFSRFIQTLPWADEDGMFEPMKTQVLVKTTDGEQEFMDFNDFSSVLVIEPNRCAKVYVKCKLVGAIYDLDIDRVKNKRQEIVFGEPVNQLLRPRSDFLSKRS